MANLKTDKPDPKTQKAPTQSAKSDAVKGSSSAAIGQHPGHADIDRGMTNLTERPMTEDEKRAAGVSMANEDAPHDYDPAVNKGTGGDLVDTYGAGQHVDHPFLAGPQADLVLGQAPVVPVSPMKGSPAAKEKFDPNVPNAINQSPILRGVVIDQRNDPAHPDHDKADPAHPDYGRPAIDHVGVRAEGPTFKELAAEQGDKDAKSK